MERQLGRYRLMEKIGSGGMGEVWSAEDSRLLRKVAVKVVNAEMVRDADISRRFLREACLAAKINHPYVATIYDVGHERDTMYIAMEFAQGEPLSAMIRNRSVTRGEAVRVVRQTAEGLSAAHEQSVIHRDVKPDNIIVAATSVKIIDFGVARPIAAVKGLTIDGTVLGTPFYMSPEQAMGQMLDARTDVYSLGVVLYESLTGRRPFQGSTVTETLVQIVSTRAADPRTLVHDLPDDLTAVVMKAMAAKRENRYQSAEELEAALDDLRYCPEPVEEVEELPPPLPGAPRALIAEADEPTRSIIGEVLASSGLQVDHALTGPQALQLLKQTPYAIAFVDLFLPRIDGWGILDFIHRNARRMPRVVVLDGAGQRFSAVDREVISAVVHKPVERMAIQNALATVSPAHHRAH